MFAQMENLFQKFNLIEEEFGHRKHYVMSSKYKAVIFDLGGVVFDSPLKGIYKVKKKRFTAHFIWHIIAFKIITILLFA